MQRGSALVFVLITLVILVVVGIGGYLAIQKGILKISNPQILKTLNPIYSNKEATVQNLVMENDEIKKDTVNDVNSLMKQYYTQKGSYPQTLVELRSVFRIEDGDLNLYSNPPFYFTSSGTAYEYYTKLNTGEIFRGDSEGTNKNLDAAVQVDVHGIFSTINIYYSNTQRLPKNLDELSTLPDTSFHRGKNNPITGKPYTYTPKEDGIGFSVSGTLSDGSEYNLEYPPVN